MIRQDGGAAFFVILTTRIIYDVVKEDREFDRIRIKAGELWKVADGVKPLQQRRDMLPIVVMTDRFAVTCIERTPRSIRAIGSYGTFPEPDETIAKVFVQGDGS